MLDGLEGIMSLAAASGESLGTTSDIVTDALTAFGMSAKDSTHFADLLATASSNANTNVSMMGETFKYVAPAAGAMGYSAEDMAEAIGLMANSGIKASQAGTSLRSVITRLATDAGASSTKLGALGVLTEKLGVQFYDSNGKARAFGDVIRETRTAWQGLDDQQAATYAKQIAGQNAISGWLALMEASEEDVEKLSAAIENCDGSSQRMADTMNNNLSGALTIFNSALEGLGIAVYNKVSGPLTDVINWGTDAISAITGWLEPAKSDLEEYIDEISKANEQIEKNLETIENTLNKDLAETSQLESYKTLFQNVVEDGKKLSDLSIADMVTAMVSDMGHLDKDGITVIDEGFLRAAGDVGNLKESDILGGVLESSAAEAAGLTDGIGEGAEESTGKVEGLADTSVADGKLGESLDGTVEMFGSVDAAAEGSSAKVKDFFAPVANEDTFWISIDSVNKKMDIFTEKEKEAAEAKGELLGSTNIQVDHGFLEAMEEIGGGLENIILVTDDLQKRNVTKAIEHLAKLRPEVKDLWNEQYGILSNNVELLDTLINMEETYLAGQAFAKARAAIYEEQGNAYMAMYQAESAANNALKEINDALENAGLEVFESLEAAKEGFTNMTPEVAAFRQENEQLVDALADASGELENANTNITNCEERLTKVNEAEQYMQEQTGFTVEEVNNLGQSMDNASDSAVGTAEAAKTLVEGEEDLTETTEDTTEATQDAAEATEEFSKQLKNAAEDGVKVQKKALENLEKEYQKLRDEMEKTVSDKAFGELWNYGAVKEGEEGADLAKIQSTMEHNMVELERWKADMEFLAGQVGNTISEGFFSSLVEQGPDAGNYIRTLVNDIQTAGGARAQSLSNAYDRTVNAEESMAGYFSALKLTMNNSLQEVAEGLDYHAFYDTVGNRLSNPEFWDSITDEQASKLDEAVRAANSIGAGISEKLAEGIRDGSISTEQAIDLINDTIVQRLYGLADQALNMGATVPEGLIEGFQSGEVSAQEAFNGIIDSIADYTHVDAQGRAVGQYYAEAVADSLASGGGPDIEYFNEAGNIIDEFTENAKANIDATGIGEKVASDTQEGIKQNEQKMVDQAVSSVDSAKGEAEKESGNFKEAGGTAMSSMADGIKETQSKVVDAVDKVAKDSLAKIDEHDKDFAASGRDIPEKLGGGVNENQRKAVDAIDAAVKAGVEAAGSHGEEFVAKGREISNSIATGAGDAVAVDGIKNAIQGAIYNAQNLDLSGFTNIGTQITNGVAQGIQNGQNTVSNAATTMAQTAYNAATQALQIQSPSKKFREGVGKMISRGTAEGILGEQAQVAYAVKKSLEGALAEAEEYVADNVLDIPIILEPDNLPILEGNSLLAPAEYLDDNSSYARQVASTSDFGSTAMQTYKDTTNLENLIEENTKSLERLVECATLMLNAAKVMGEKVGVTIINEIDGSQFDSRIKSVSQKAINQRAKQLAYAGGR